MLDTGDAPYILHSETVAPKHVTGHQDCHITPPLKKKLAPSVKNTSTKRLSLLPMSPLPEAKLHHMNHHPKQLLLLDHLLLLILLLASL